MNLQPDVCTGKEVASPLLVESGEAICRVLCLEER